MINIRILNPEVLENALEQLPKRVTALVKDVFRKNSRLLQTHIRLRYMSGGSKDSLARRSGTLAARTIPVPVRASGGIITAGVTFGTVYAKTHIGYPGQTTTIKPKRGKYLAIPLDAMKTKAGVARGGTAFAKQKFGKTFVQKSKKGNLIIFASKLKGRGKKRKSELIPLFVLKKSVTIKTRIHPYKLINYIEPRIIRDLKEFPL